MPGCTPSRSARLRCPAWSAVVLNAAPPVGDLLPRCASGLGGHLPAAMVATCPVVHTAGAGDASARPCDCAGCSPARAKLRRVARAAVHTVLNYRGILGLVFHPVPAIRPGMTCFVVSAQPAEVIALSATGRRVLIVSASMGGGHDGAAFELARRLRTRGYDVEVRDFLQAWPRLVARIVKTSYLFQLKVAPPTYDWLYRGIELIPVIAAIARLIAGWACRRLRQWVRDDDVAVISTYPLASQALGQLKANGHIRAPLATFLTDFSVHRLWVSPYVDLHLAAHPVTAAAAERLGAGYTVVTGPVVPPRFAALPPGERAAVRARKRAELGVPANATVALLVTGSWGVGDVAHTAAGITTSGAAVPVIVCGRNTALLQRLRHRGVGVALGWVDDMPALMAASDVLVQNAGEGLHAGQAAGALHKYVAGRHQRRHVVDPPECHTYPAVAQPLEQRGVPAADDHRHRSPGRGDPGRRVRHVADTPGPGHQQRNRRIRGHAELGPLARPHGGPLPGRESGEPRRDNWSGYHGVPRAQSLGGGRGHRVRRQV